MSCLLFKSLDPTCRRKHTKLMEAQTDDSTHCPVCFEAYEETGYRLPRLLPCVHTLCHGCVKGLIQGDTLVCPQDRQGYPARNGAKSFPKIKYILNNLKRQGNKQGTYAGVTSETCELHGQRLMFYCKKCEQIICPACIIVKHQEHNVIDVFNEKIDVAPYADKLIIYKDKLQRAKQELLDEYNENLTKLQNRKDELMKDVEKRIAEVTKEIDALEDVKEKANVRATVRETLTKFEVIENIKERIMQTFNRPLQYTSQEVTNVETTVYLSGEKERFPSKTIRLFWAGMKASMSDFLSHCKGCS